jgi:pyruvate dehydrogenase E2 component (dihydrolipoamide acetyltransferase)
VRGTGVGGLITEQDVQAAAAPANVRPLDKARRAIAERMAHSKQTAPHFYLAVDVDMGRCEQLRVHCREELHWLAAPSFTDIVVRACAEALAATPDLNASYTNEGLALRSAVDVGVAVAVAAGLMVPVLHNADRLSLLETSRGIQALVERARSGRLNAGDVAAKSLVVSNLGMYGVNEFVAIIDPPDPMILAVGQVADRVVALEGRPTVRRMCTLWLSADHRVMDGVQAAQFLKRVQDNLEDPYGRLGSLQ